QARDERTQAGSSTAATELLIARSMQGSTAPYHLAPARGSAADRALQRVVPSGEPVPGGADEGMPWRTVTISVNLLSCHHNDRPEQDPRRRPEDVQAGPDGAACRGSDARRSATWGGP